MALDARMKRRLVQQCLGDWEKHGIRISLSFNDFYIHVPQVHAPQGHNVDPHTARNIELSDRVDRHRPGTLQSKHGCLEVRKQGAKRSNLSASQMKCMNRTRERQRQQGSQVN